MVLGLWNIFAPSKQWTALTKSKKYILRKHSAGKVYILWTAEPKSKTTTKFIGEITICIAQ